MFEKFGIVAYMPINADVAIVILATDGDSVTTGIFNGERVSRKARNNICYNSKGEPYFTKYGRREYLANYLRTNIF